MLYVEAPSTRPPENARTTNTSVFLAGGITGCPDWQSFVVHELESTNLVLLNPRRANFPIDDPDAAHEQIKWEHDHLRAADVIAFWFPCETLCPIALYELGAWSMTAKPLVVGVHDDYARRLDVELQTELVRPDVPIMRSLDNVVHEIQYLASS